MYETARVGDDRGRWVGVRVRCAAVPDDFLPTRRGTDTVLESESRRPRESTRRRGATIP